MQTKRPSLANGASAFYPQHWPICFPICSGNRAGLYGRSIASIAIPAALSSSRNAKAERDLMEQFRQHTVERRYLALVRGQPKAGKIESTIVRDRGDGRRGSSTAEGDGQRAVTHVKLVEALGNYALIECRLETGRTHQVRIHLGEAGTPLCGEHVYDREVNGKPVADGSGTQRPMLHAAKLGFRHPETEEKMSWSCPLPEDMAELLDELRADDFKS